MQLGDGAAAAIDGTVQAGGDQIVLRPGVRRGDDPALDVTLDDPREARGREALPDIEALRAAGVVDAEGGPLPESTISRTGT